MKRFVRVCLLLALTGSMVAAANSRDSAPLPEPANILFVGNSFSYYNNGLQNQLLELLKSAGIETGTQRLLGLSGGRLREHVASLPAIVANGDWDVVVLQGHSREALAPDQLAEFRAAAADLDAVVRAGGARTALFMTWAYRGAPEETAVIARNYSALGEQLDVQVVPVGLAFAAVTENYPDIRLRMDDERHPTLAGTYLAGCTFFAALVGRSPQGLDYDAGLGAGVADRLQSAAWTAVQGFYGKPN